MTGDQPPLQPISEPPVPAGPGFRAPVFNTTKTVVTPAINAGPIAEKGDDSDPHGQLVNLGVLAHLGTSA